jgi:hypothetical protein
MTATAHIDTGVTEHFTTQPFDALSVLDHHTRAQTIPADEAGPWRS